jgi:hypothetical protein
VEVEPAGHGTPAGLLELVGQVNPGAALQLPEQSAEVRPAVAPKRPAGHTAHADALPGE